MPAEDYPRAFGRRVRQLREERGISQETLAAKARLHRTHISLIERGKRQIRLDTIAGLAAALSVHPSMLFLHDQIETELPASDRESLEIIYPFLLEFQKLGNRHGVADVFQDNGGKHLQALIILGLMNLDKREGNDARDRHGKEYELKSVNRLLAQSFSTHHHLNPTILKKYRSVHGWYFSIYENIRLEAIYLLRPQQLEPYFQRWEDKWNETSRDINNPKIPIKFVEAEGIRVHP